MTELLDLMRSNALIIPTLIAALSGVMLLHGKNIAQLLWSAVYTRVASTVTIYEAATEFNWVLQYLSAQPRCLGDMTYALGVDAGMGEVVDSSALVMGTGVRWYYIDDVGLLRASFRIERNQNTQSIGFNAKYTCVLVVTTFGSKNKLHKLIGAAKSFAETSKTAIEVKNGTVLNTIPKTTRDNIIVSDEIYHRTVMRAKEFLNSEELYVRRGIAYKLGIFLYGPPGTGKSGIVRLLASELNGSIFVPTTSSVYELAADIKWWQRSHSGPTIVAFEDFEQTSEHKFVDHLGRTTELLGPYAKSHFLNFLDGLSTPHGIIFVFTSNHKDTLPPAMLRPGRIDVLLEVGYMRAPEITKLCAKFDIVISPDDALLLEQYEPLTAATLQEYILGHTLDEELQRRRTLRHIAAE